MPRIKIERDPVVNRISYDGALQSVKEILSLYTDGRPSFVTESALKLWQQAEQEQKELRSYEQRKTVSAR